MNDETPTDSLLELRERLDETDRRIVEALAERLSLVGEVARLKSGGAHAPRDPKREAELLERIETIAEEAGIDPWLASHLYREILRHTVRMQEEHLVDRHIMTLPGDLPPRVYHLAVGLYDPLTLPRMGFTGGGGDALTWPLEVQANP